MAYIFFGSTLKRHFKVGSVSGKNVTGSATLVEYIKLLNTVDLVDWKVPGQRHICRKIIFPR